MNAPVVEICACSHAEQLHKHGVCTVTHYQHDTLITCACTEYHHEPDRRKRWRTW
jgi:hypothetical protein